MASAPARQLNSKVGSFPLLFAIRVRWVKFFTDLDFNELWLLWVVPISISMSFDMRRILGRLSADTPPYSIDNQTRTDRQSINMSVSYWLIIDQASSSSFISVEYRWTVVGISVKVRSNIGCVIVISAKCRRELFALSKVKHILLFCGFVRTSLDRWPNFDRLSKDISTEYWAT